MSAKNVGFTWVLLGCPRKMLVLHWFYKVVREKCWKTIGFTRLSAGCPRKMLKSHVFFIAFAQKLSTDNRHGLARTLESICLTNSPSCTIESPLARPHSFASPRPLARTNETKRFPGWGHSVLTPQPPIIYMNGPYSQQSIGCLRGKPLANRLLDLIKEPL